MPRARPRSTHSGAARARDIASVIVAEFDEMPGTRLTMMQVCRLWGLARQDAERIIGGLVADRILAVEDDGRVCRARDLER